MAATNTPQRFHWINTVVGILDSTFHLTDEEQFLAITVVSNLLDTLAIPDRGDPVEIPAVLALEMDAEFYTIALSKPRKSGVRRPVRPVGYADTPVSIEAWCQAFQGMFKTAYPDLDPFECIGITKAFANLLTGLGLPTRAASYTPDDVLRAYRAIDLAQ